MHPLEYEFRPRKTAPQWDRCNLCGKRFPTWRELSRHKNKHTQQEVDAKTVHAGGPSRPMKVQKRPPVEDSNKPLEASPD
jgi:hypothetical protein